MTETEGLFGKSKVAKKKMTHVFFSIGKLKFRCFFLHLSFLSEVLVDCKEKVAVCGIGWGKPRKGYIEVIDSETVVENATLKPSRKNRNPMLRGKNSLVMLYDAISR